MNKLRLVLAAPLLALGLLAGSAVVQPAGAQQIHRSYEYIYDGNGNLIAIIERVTIIYE